MYFGALWEGIKGPYLTATQLDYFRWKLENAPPYEPPTYPMHPTMYDAIVAADPEFADNEMYERAEPLQVEFIALEPSTEASEVFEFMKETRAKIIRRFMVRFNP